MEPVLRAVDIVSMWTIWWVCFSFLVGRGPASCVRTLALDVGLLAVMTFSFAGALAVAAAPHDCDWWDAGMRSTAALVAAAIYDQHFSIPRQLRSAGRWLRGLLDPCDGEASK